MVNRGANTQRCTVAGVKGSGLIPESAAMIESQSELKSEIKNDETDNVYTPTVLIVSVRATITPWYPILGPRCDLEQSVQE